MKHTHSAPNEQTNAFSTHGLVSGLKLQTMTLNLPMFTWGLHSQVINNTYAALVRFSKKVWWQKGQLFYLILFYLFIYI